jgi:hypothetical protein
MQRAAGDAPFNPHEIHAMCRERGPDAAIGALADLQHDAVGHEQLERLGLGRGAIAHRLKLGRLHRHLPGAYTVGGAGLGREGRLMAAVLSLGHGAVISHRSAADLWGIRKTATAIIEVTLERRVGPRASVYQHESRLPSDERTTRDRIPVTTPGRTLIDLAAVLSPTALERALERAEGLRITHRVPLSELLSRYPRRPGTRTLRELLTRSRAKPTRDELEARFQEFLSDAGFPRPSINVPLHLNGRWLELDCLWAPQRLVVELDGYETHGTRAAFVRDRRRDRLLEAAGFAVIRVTWWDLDPGEHRAALERDLHLLLRRSAA